MYLGPSNRGGKHSVFCACEQTKFQIHDIFSSSNSKAPPPQAPAGTQHFIFPGISAELLQHMLNHRFHGGPEGGQCLEQLTFACLSIWTDLKAALTVTSRPSWSHRTVFLTPAKRTVGNELCKKTKKRRSEGLQTVVSIWRTACDFWKETQRGV